MKLKELQKFIIQFFGCKDENCEGCEEDANAIIEEVTGYLKEMEKEK